MRDGSGKHVKHVLFVISIFWTSDGNSSLPPQSSPSQLTMNFLAFSVERDTRMDSPHPAHSLTCIVSR